MSTTEEASSQPELPRDRLNSPASTSVPIDGAMLDYKPKRARPSKIFREMPLLVKISAIWLILVVSGAVYAKLDTTLFNGALPLKDPLLQTNNFDPSTGEFGTGQKHESPSWAHWLGTDAIARDTFARLVHGAWVSLIVAAVAAGCGVIIGGLLGSLVGYVRGRTEIIVMSMIDVILAFPALILLLALVSIFKVRSLTLISVVIGVLGIPAYTRVSRANSLAISNREFVLAAKAIGTKSRTVLFREIIPNVLPTVLSYAMVAAAFVVVVEGTLSFLGLSVQLPQPTWGNMINQARGERRDNTAQLFWPCLVLTMTVLSLNQVGDFFQRRTSSRDTSL
ncbi:MAG: ABC transporter permease [Actinomycetia bacterium]|nr:ABC transporter permease [Actinomycetes bacterium]